MAISKSGRVSHSAQGLKGLHRDPFALGDGGAGARLMREQGGSQSLLQPVAPIPLNPAIIEGFVQTYLAYKYDNKCDTPPFHRELWELFCRPEDRICAAAPRGHAKSTAITEAYVLCDVLFRNSDYVVVVSETYPQAVEFIREYKTELQQNDQLIEDFGVGKFLKDTEDDIIVEFKDKKQFRIRALASEGAVRGIKWNKKRPNKIVFDDIEGDEQVESPTRRLKLRNWFFQALLPAGSKTCKVRGVGTIMHFDSLLSRLLKNKVWFSKIFQAHAAFDDFSNILWPEMYSEERLKAIKSEYIEDGNPDGYSREYLNQPLAEGKRFFRAEDLLPLPPRFSHASYPKYASWDFAVSKDQAADYTVCIVFAVDELGHIYVIDVRRGRLGSNEIIEEIFAVEEAWQPEVHFMERGVIEKSLGPFLSAQMATRAIYPIIDLVVPVKDKVTRARSWQAKTKAHHVHYDKDAEWWDDLFEEMQRFPKSKHDDQVDAQSQFGLMLDQIRNATSPEEEQEEEYQRAQHYAALDGRSATTGY